MQEQIQETLIESGLVHQNQQDLSDHVVAKEPKINNIHVSHTTNPLFIPQPRITIRGVNGYQENQN